MPSASANKKCPAQEVGYPGLLYPIPMIQPHSSWVAPRYEPGTKFSIERFPSYATSNNQKISAQPRGVSACFIKYVRLLLEMPSRWVLCESHHGKDSKTTVQRAYKSWSRSRWGCIGTYTILWSHEWYSGCHDKQNRRLSKPPKALVESYQTVKYMQGQGGAYLLAKKVAFNRRYQVRGLGPCTRYFCDNFRVPLPHTPFSPPPLPLCLSLSLSLPPSPLSLSLSLSLQMIRNVGSCTGSCSQSEKGVALPTEGGPLTQQ